MGLNVEEIPIEEGGKCYSCRGDINILYSVGADIYVGQCIKCGKFWHVAKR